MQDLDRLEPWIDDGNVILAVEGRYFRVHRSTLRSYSEVFKDMFAIPHSHDTEKEMMDGCPVIHLQDPVDDVQAMLKALYDRSYVFPHGTPMPLSVLTAFVRLGKKYAIHQLLEEAKGRLLFDAHPLVVASTMSAKGNTTLFPRVSGNDPFNFRVTNIASEAGLSTQVIVAALYCCIACPALSIADGYDFDGVRCTLSASNQRCCLLAQRHLEEVERRLYHSLAYSNGSCDVGKSKCSPTLLSAICAFQRLKQPSTQWMDNWGNGLCRSCKTECREGYERSRAMSWKNLPVDLGLGCWENPGDDVKVPELSKSLLEDYDYRF